MGSNLVLQIVELIPGHLVKKLSIKYGVDKKSRSFTPWSYVVSKDIADYFCA